MDRIQNTRFSFRRKGSNKKKDKDQEDLAFDCEKLSYVSLEKAREIFEELVTEYSFSVDRLLELFGFSCAVAISKIYPKESLLKGKGSILVCCGPGKNGGTGLVCARHLKMFGYRPTVFYPKPQQGNALYQGLATQCEKMDIPFLLYLPSEAQLVTDSYSLLIDAIFGLGYQPPLSPDFATILQTLVKSRVPVVSLETPSAWEDDAEVQQQADVIQPEVLISLFVPTAVSREFKGKHQVVGGRILPPDLVKKYNLVLPPFYGSDLVQELKALQIRSSSIDGEQAKNKKDSGECPVKDSVDDNSWE